MLRHFACLGLVFSFFLLILLVPPGIQAADFDYRPYEPLLHHYLRIHVRIDGIWVNAVDYTGLVEEAGKQGSEMPIERASPLRSLII